MAHYAVALKDVEENLVIWGRPVTEEEFTTANEQIKPTSKNETVMVNGKRR